MFRSLQLPFLTSLLLVFSGLGIEDGRASKPPHGFFVAVGQMKLKGTLTTQVKSRTRQISPIHGSGQSQCNQRRLLQEL